MEIRDFLKSLWSSEAVAIIAILAGIGFIATAAGIITGFQFFKGAALPSPTSRTGKVLWYLLGIGFIGFGIYRARAHPEYKSIVDEKWVYRGNDAKQIVADGETIYLLKENGNIHRIVQKEVPLLDPGTDTKQIAPAGGVLYILKNDGEIWACQPGSDTYFRKIYEETGTRQIELAGETLYILKENGNILKSVTPLTGDDVGTINIDFIQIDDGTGTPQIVSSGSILCALKKRGNIWKYAPIMGQSFVEIYKKGEVESIEADGTALYFIKTDGTPCKYRECVTVLDSLKTVSPKDPCEGMDLCVVIDKNIRAKKIDALGSVVYILTNEGKIFRYNAETDQVRELTEAGEDNEDIAAYYQDLFVIKKNGGGVKRYNEGRLKR